MPTYDKPRFRVENGQIIDGGVKISRGELESYLRRQEQAMQTNTKMGPLGEKVNQEMIMPEYNNALEIYKQIQLSPAAIVPPKT